MLPRYFHTLSQKIKANKFKIINCDFLHFNITQERGGICQARMKIENKNNCKNYLIELKIFWGISKCSLIKIENI